MTDDVFVQVEDRSGVGEARRRVSELARRLGFDEVAVGRVAIAVTELASNLVDHARGGALFARAHRPGDEAAVEILTMDAGPGIPDLSQALEDGFSTGESPGTGLGAVARLSDAFQIHSAPGSGTVSLSRIHPRPTDAGPAPGFDLGVVRRPDPREDAPGDDWAIREVDGGAALTVVDGLGHGPKAGHASMGAVQAFLEGPWEGPARVLSRMNEAIQPTRGAAGMVVEVGAEEVRWAGIGNVSGVVLRRDGDGRQALVSRNGILGNWRGREREEATPFGPGDLLILHTDGIQTRWRPEELRPVLDRAAPLVAGLLYLLHYRGRDDATAVVLRHGGG